MPIKIRSGAIVKLGVYYRPYMTEMIEKLSKLFDLHIFTSSDKEYADMILKQIDPKDKFFKERWYKGSCSKSENGQYIKDLSLLGLPLDRTVLVDNSTFSFGHQLLNGVPIISYTGSQTDTELVSLLDYLQHLSRSGDVRKTNADYFKFHQVAELSLDQDFDTIFERCHK